MNDTRITAVALSDTDIAITLANGRVLRTPIRRYIRVEKATPAERERWVLTGDEYGINWPELWEPSADGMVDVWSLLQDEIYEAALARLKSAGWDVNAITPRDRELVALWRMEADINNGGFMQFLCNWGEENLCTALAALKAIGAPATLQLLEAMYTVVEPYGQTDEVVSLGELPGLLTEAENNRLQELNRAFGHYPDPLPRLVAQHYGDTADHLHT